MFIKIIICQLLVRPAIDVHITDTSFSEEHFDFVSGVLKFTVTRLGP